MSTALATRPHNAPHQGSTRPADGMPLIRIRPAPSPEPGEDLQRAGDRDLPPRPRIDWASAAPGAHEAHSAGGATPAAARPSEARLAAHRYLSLCVEVLGGFRPPAHLRAMTAAEAYSQVIAQLQLRQPGQAAARPAAERVVLRHMRVFEPVDGAAEVAAVLSRGDRVWAMALRLERSPFGWLCRQLWVL
ncbi:MAG: hypothetical protein J2P15_04970 [Micromonosporaceae bacterium]|nr:hypothetical protein [Micromonosporaceae bacterium]